MMPIANRVFSKSVTIEAYVTTLRACRKANMAPPAFTLMMLVFIVRQKKFLPSPVFCFLYFSSHKIYFWSAVSIKKNNFMVLLLSQRSSTGAVRVTTRSHINESVCFYFTGILILLDTAQYTTKKWIRLHHHMVSSFTI